MKFFTERAKARMAGVSCSTIALTVLSSAALAGPATYEATSATASVRATPQNREVVSLPVRYGDLNLASDQGIATLKSRIVQVAHRICDNPDDRGLARSTAARQCMDAAVADAMAQAAVLSSTARPLAAR